MNIRRFVCAACLVGGLLVWTTPFVSAQEITEGVEAAMEELGISVEASSAGDVYVVESGDTLWDLCELFFGDPETWPGLWSINNEEITNPHYIYPGQMLRLQAGTDIRPPSLVVGAGLPAEIASRYDDDTFEPKAALFSTVSDCKLHIPFREEQPRDMVLSAPLFISRSPIQPLGRVEKAIDSKSMLSKGDVIYMRFSNTSDVDCGRIYSLYHSNSQIRHPEVKSANLGHSYEVSAEVLISDVGERWVTGQVVQSFSEFTRGELITDRLPVSGRVRTNELDQVVDGYIIDTGRDENDLIQPNQVVFVDRGKTDGVRSGSIFWVVRRGDGLSKQQRVDATLPDQVIGRLVVFSADEYVATAVMTDQAVEVEVGDRITSHIN